MPKYEFKLNDNKYIIKDIDNNIEIKIQKHIKGQGYDVFYIKSFYTFDFIKYVCEQLKKEDELAVVILEFENLELEKYIISMGLKSEYYQYCIKINENKLNNKYEITTELDNESKKYLLDKINDEIIKNNKFYNYPLEDGLFGENFFNNFSFSYNIYKQNNKLVGMVCYKVFDANNHYYEHDYDNCSNKTCITCLYGDNDIVIKDILYDLNNTYKKDIVVTVSYPKQKYKKFIDSLNSHFDYEFFSDLRERSND